jgi:hypothetical protein
MSARLTYAITPARGNCSRCMRMFDARLAELYGEPWGDVRRHSGGSLKTLTKCWARRMAPMLDANVAGAVTRTSGSPVQAAFLEIMGFELSDAGLSSHVPKGP